MKPVVCKHCGAVDKHHSIACYYQLKKPIKKSAARPVKIKAVKIKPANARSVSLMDRPLPWLLNHAQEWFNKYIRLRDSKNGMFKCISCGAFKSNDQLNAGHFYSVGGHSYLRFNEKNVHGQCIKCNCHEHANLLNYRKNLIKKIGQEEVDKLETWCKFSHKWDKIQVIAIIQLYKEKCKTDFL